MTDQTAVWIDGDPLMEAIARDVWEQCRTEGTSLVVDDPRNIAAVAAAVARGHAAVPAPATDRAALSAKLWEIAEHRIVAEWICCEPLDPKHGLCAKGYAALEMTKSLLVDSPEAWNPNAPLLDAVLAVLPETADRDAELGFVVNPQTGQAQATGGNTPVSRAADRAPTLRELEQQQRPNTPPSRPEPRLPDHTVNEEETPSPVKQRADCTELEWAVQERARFERLYTRETVRADLAEQRADTAARDADIYQKRLERLSEGYTDQRKRAEAMERAMESTAADASAHRFCHMRLMAQCQRAEQAEAEAERLRAGVAATCICGHTEAQHFEDACLVCNCGDYLPPAAAREVIASLQEAARREVPNGAAEFTAADLVAALRGAGAERDKIEAQARTTGRAAVLREAADFAEDVAVRLHNEHDVGGATGAYEAMTELRRMADETQQPSIHANDVQGFCPSCGHPTLYVGAGGHLTCSLMDCPKPEAADELLHGVADETQQPEAQAEDPARIDRIRPEFTEHSSVEAIDIQLQRARSQQRRWHLRAEWLISLRQRRVDQKARGEWPAASNAAVQQPKEA